MSFGDFPCLENYRAAKECNTFCDGKKPMYKTKKQQHDWVKTLLWILLGLFALWLLYSLFKPQSTTVVQPQPVPMNPSSPVIINQTVPQTTAKTTPLMMPRTKLTKNTINTADYVTPNCQAMYPQSSVISPAPPLWSTAPGCEGCPIPRNVFVPQTPVYPQSCVFPSRPQTQTQTWSSPIVNTTPNTTTTTTNDCNLIRQSMAPPVTVY